VEVHVDLLVENSKKLRQQKKPLMSLFSKPIMAQFSRFHMREQDAAKLVKEKEDKK
jgi:hypothetical protein